MTSTLITPRKIFNYNNITENKIVYSLYDFKNLYKKTISACGCLFYKIDNNKVQLLLIKYDNINFPKLDDFGGKIDMNDQTIFDAISREVSEETNKIINKDLLELIILNNRNINIFYNKKSKYYMKLIEVDNSFYIDTHIFGEYEENNNINRTIKWYNYDKIKEQLSLRLLNNIELIRYLDNLNNNLIK